MRADDRVAALGELARGHRWIECRHNGVELATQASLLTRMLAKECSRLVIARA